MRVITGTARGRKLVTPEGMDVRPTVDRVKEGIFSAIQFDIEGRTVLDLFAGSGQLGIESLSRGASLAVFVDNSTRSLDAVKQNLKSTGLEKSARVISSDSLTFLKGKTERFDIAFLDPPYKNGLIEKAMPDLINIMSDHGIIICEHPADEKLDERFGRFVCQKVYRYGKVSVSIYRAENPLS